MCLSDTPFPVTWEDYGTAYLPAVTGFSLHLRGELQPVMFWRRFQSPAPPPWRTVSGLLFPFIDFRDIIYALL
jgi:hypothetical protein